MASGTLRDAFRRLKFSGFMLAKAVVQKARALLEPAAPKHTVMVVAAQRSGTTMMMRVLQRSFETDVLFESDPRAYDNCEIRSVDVVRPVIARSMARHVVFKPMCDLQDLDRLLDTYAPAKAIWMLRDWRDVVNSHLALWTGMPENIGRIVQDRDSAGWRGRGMSDQTLRRVRKLYHADISNASACALFWYFRNIKFFELNLDTDPRVLLVRYEPLVTNPQTEFGRVFEFLGIPYAPQLAQQVFAASVGKQPPPRVDPPIQALCDELAQRFAALPDSPGQERVSSRSARA